MSILSRLSFSSPLMLAAALVCAGHAEAAPITNAAAFATTATPVTYSLAGASAQDTQLPSGATFCYKANVVETVSYGSDGDGAYVQLALANPNPRSADVSKDWPLSGTYQLCFGGNQDMVSPTSLLRFNTKVKVLPAMLPDGTTLPISAQTRITTKLGVDGKFLADVAEELADGFKTTAQALQANVLTGSINPLTPPGADGTVAPIAKAVPMLIVDSLLPGEQVVLRLYSAQTIKYGISKNLIQPLDATSSVRPGALGKLTVRLTTSGSSTGLASGNNHQGDLELVSAGGTVTALGSKTIVVKKPATAGAVSEIVVPFQGLLPSLSSGTYTVQFRLRPNGQTKGVQLVGTSPSVVETGSATATKGFAYKLGSIKLDSVGGGLFIGGSAVKYPHEYNSANVKVTAESLFGTTYGPKQLGMNMVRSTLALLPWTTTTLGGTQPVFDPASYTRAYREEAGAFKTISLPQLTMAEWATYFSPSTTAPKKNLLINTWGVPYEASSEPQSVENGFFQGGIASPVSVNGKAAYTNYLSKVFSTYGTRMFAIECGNEPNIRTFWTGTQTQLADSCKAVFDARKLAGKTQIPILCPQVDSPEKLSYVLAAKTSEATPQPLTNYCDWVGAHIYSGVGSDYDGKPYSHVSLSEQIRIMRTRMMAWNVGTKPLVVTEFGIHRAAYSNASALAFGRPASLENLSDAEKADAVYQSIATFLENGVTGVGLYGIDMGGPEAGGFLWTVKPGTTAYNDVVMKRLSTAVKDMAWTKSPW